MKKQRRKLLVTISMQASELDAVSDYLSFVALFF